MKLTETQISKTLKMDDILLYEPNVILDNGYGNYTHKLIIKYITKDGIYSSFRVLFNQNTMSAKLNDAFMKAKINPYGEYPEDTNPTFELINCVYYDVNIKECDQEHYEAFKDYVNCMNKNRDMDIWFLYGIKINKGEYSANGGMYSTKVQGGYFKL